MKILKLFIYTSIHCNHCIALKQEIAYVFKQCRQKNMFYMNFDADNDKKQFDNVK